VRAGIEYFVFQDNPNSAELSRVGGTPSHFTQRDGSFQLVAVPGRSLIAVRGSEDKYRMGVGADKLEGKLDDGPFFNTLPYATTNRGSSR
jgi:hypothetical protein